MAKKKWGKEEIIGRVEPRNQSRGRGSYGMIDLEPSRRWCDLRPTDCLVVHGWRYGLRLRHSRGGIDAGPVVAVGVRDPLRSRNPSCTGKRGRRRAGGGPRRPWLPPSSPAKQIIRIRRCIIFVMTTTTTTMIMMMMVVVVVVNTTMFMTCDSKKRENVCE